MKQLSLLVVMLSGCATVGSGTFVSKETLTFDRAKYADDAAVVLHRQDRTELLVQNGDDLTRASRHEVVAILAEGGLDLAEVKVPFNAKWQFASFKARIIRPDGTEQELGADAMLSDTSGSGERDSNARFFRFPDVSVGCVLEYLWTIEAPYVWSHGNQATLGVFPVRHYDFELTASKELVLETIELNGGAPIQMRTGNDGSHTLKFELDDLPPRKTVDASPNWTFTEPRWAWRVLAYKTNAFTYDWSRNWTDVVNYTGRRFWGESELTDGFDATIDTKDCKDTTCLAQRAASKVFDNTITWRVAWDRTENLGKAWKSGKASAVERALMVKTLLEQRDVDVWLAYGTGRLNEQTMPSFPNADQFDRLFVYLPAQKGLAAPLIVDVGCDACRVGELAPEYAGTKLYVFKTSSELQAFKTKGRWETAPNVSPVGGFVVTHAVKLGEGGALTDDVQFKYRGDEAMGTIEDHRTTPHKLWEWENDRALRSSPLADLAVAKWTKCAYPSCEWVTQVNFPNEASRDGDRLLVPTSFLRPAWEEMYLPTERTTAIHLREPDHYEEVAELKVADGLELVTVPPAQKLGPQGFKVEVSYERIPGGVRIKRKVTQDITELPKEKYGELRAAVEAFRRARREVLVFAPRANQ